MQPRFPSRLCAGLVVVWLLSPAGLFAADDAVMTFERLLSDAQLKTQQRLFSQAGQTPGAWITRQYTVQDLRYDVRKTDSLVSPLVGLVTFTLETTAMGYVPAQDTNIKAAGKLKMASARWAIRLTYAYHDATWVLSHGTTTMLIGESSQSSPIAVTADSIRHDAMYTPHEALIYWLPQ